MIHHARRGLTAACEALFPENDFGAPDYRTTDLVRRTLEYLDILPAAQRRLLLTLFVVVELGSVVLVRGFTRFSRLSPERRVRVVRRWRRSRFLPFRVLGDAVKAVTTLIYVSHPAALEYAGAYAGCDHPLDSFPLKRGTQRAEAVDDSRP